MCGWTWTTTAASGIRSAPRSRSSEASPGAGSLPFVVQRHAARRLHYDLRLERNGVLASWAVPKGVPTTTGERHLAVHVEDHPLSYADFEGEIPAGQYGAGASGDLGSWHLRARRGEERRRSHGSASRVAARGVWALVPAGLDGDPKNWLLLCKAGGATAREYAPCSRATTDSLPTGDGWAFEPKWDGFRALARIVDGEATLRSRNGNDLTARVRGCRASSRARRSSSQSAVLDGEVCALDESGRSSLDCCSGTGRPASLPSTCSSATVCRCSTRRSTTGGRRSSIRSTRRSPVVLLSPSFDDGAALERGRA